MPGIQHIVLLLRESMKPETYHKWRTEFYSVFTISEEIAKIRDPIYISPIYQLQHS